jgi:hypothetical protein
MRGSSGSQRFGCRLTGSAKSESKLGHPQTLFGRTSTLRYFFSCLWDLPGVREFSFAVTPAPGLPNQPGKAQSATGAALR